MTVRRIYALRRNNLPRAIAEILNKDGIGWKDGTPWTTSRVYATLRAPVYAGYRYDPWEEKWIKGAWEAIVTIEEYARVNKNAPPAHGDGP